MTDEDDTIIVAGPSDDPLANPPKDPLADALQEHLAAKRMAEAMIFASDSPLTLEDLTVRLPDGLDVEALVDEIAEDCTGRGFELVRLAGGYSFRTAPDLAFLLRREVDVPRKLSRAAVETMAIIAYHQPVTRAEVEAIRGVTISKGTLDVLMEAGWVRLLGRRRTPGRPVTYGTSDAFLVHFGLDTLRDLPGLADLKASGMLDSVEDAYAQEEMRLEAGDDPQIDLEDAIDAAERGD